ncbi:MAG: Lrp/AsnC family transcriptional regulator [Magnetococcales bacterium]|nr:Lrp/AsnC family transcriptional regulator [Magnetococcales bacterium]
MPMDSRAIRIINGLQSGFPLLERPFAVAGEPLELSEESLIDGLAELSATGLITRFGPFYHAERLGGGLTLAALRVPVSDFEWVTEVVNAQPEVAHNYAREHAFNMWFVVATEKREEIPAVLERIQALTSLEVFNLPKIEEYRLGFQVQLDEHGGIDTTPLFDDPVEEDERCTPDELDRALIAATQGGLPLVPEPYHRVGGDIGVTVDTVVARFQAMLRRGWIRRVGLACNHHRLGLQGNGMSVWDVPDDKLCVVGNTLSELDFVTHCYARPRHPPEWPYNLFVMVHGPNRTAVMDKIRILERIIGKRQRGHLVLHSTRILKKTGLRIKAPGVTDGCSV